MVDMVELEEELRGLAQHWTLVKKGECSLCYVRRMLADFECAHQEMRWVDEFHRQNAPTVKSLRQRIRRARCDCGVFSRVFGATWKVEKQYWDFSDPIHPCKGARPGSTKPCDWWRPLPRPKR